MQMIGFGPWLKFIWKGHISNWIWRDRLRRRLVRNNAFGEYKMSYLKKYIPFVKSLKAPEPEETDGEQAHQAFTLWFQGEENAPQIVKLCLKSIRERFGDDFTILTEKTLYDYINLPDCIREKWKQKKIVAANFSDIVRIELLYQHGGYWFDATDYLTGDVPSEIKKAPFFMYVTSDVYFPHMFVQTCFMHSVKKDPLLEMWRKLVHEYWKNEEMACEYFLVHMLLKLLVTHNEEARQLFDRMPKMTMDATHVLWYRTGNLPYDKDMYDEMCRNAFFQKCSYKKQSKSGVNKIIPGSMADATVNGFGR